MILAAVLALHLAGAAPAAPVAPPQQQAARGPLDRPKRHFLPPLIRPPPELAPRRTRPFFQPPLKKPPASPLGQQKGPAAGFHRLEAPSGTSAASEG